MTGQSVLVPRLGWRSGSWACRSLSAAGFVVITGEEEGRVANRTRYSSELLRHPRVSEEPGAFAEWVEDTCARRGIAAILPMDDEVVQILGARARPLVGGAVLVGPTPEQYRALCDKALLAAACRQVGFLSPRHVIVTASGTHEDGWPPLPSMVKPRAPGMSGVEGLVTVKPTLVRTAVEREAAVHRLIASVGEAMVEEQVRGSAWRVHFVRSRESFAWLTLRSVRAYPPRTGQSSVQRVAGQEPELAALAERLVARCGYVGPGSVQAFRSRDGYVVHDVNLRLPVSVGASITAGLDMPALAVAASLGGELPAAPTARGTALYVSLLGEVSQLLDGLRGRDVAARPRRVMVDILRAAVGRDGVLDPVDARDPLPILLGVGEIVRRRLRGGRRPVRRAKAG